MFKKIVSIVLTVIITIGGIQFSQWEKVNAATSAGESDVSELDVSSDPSDITRIYVVTDEENPTITKENKTPGKITIVSGEEAVNSVSNTGTIKLRGNSTSLADKPAYNISFSSKEKVFTGAEKGKKWCLLANAYDKSMLRNKLAMDLGRALGKVAAPEEHYADLYINGELKGTYLISEPAENGRAGIDFDDENDNEMMFEWEYDRVEDGQTYYRTGLGIRFVVADPEGLETNSTKYYNWVNTLATFEGALTQTTSDRVFDYIDVDSFVDMYIVNELFGTVDFGYSSVKFYIKNDENGNPIIHAGSLWDFDLSSGNSSVEYNRRTDTFRCQEVNAWFGYLMRNNTFKNKVIAKFKAMQPRIQNIYQENGFGISQIDKNLNYMGISKDRNYSPVSEGGAGWSESQPDSAEFRVYPYGYSTLSPYINYTYEQHIEYLANWLKTRNQWLCSQWGIDYETAGEQIVSEDVSVTGYQMTSSLYSISGNMGMRVVYQTEPEIYGMEVAEQGLIYGLVYGDNPISKEDLIYNSESEYIKTYAATEAGKSSEIMGDSDTASYYVMTMSCGTGDGTDNVTTEAFTTTYYVRPYAKTAEGTIIYGDAVSYSIYKVADYIYQHQIVNNKITYDYIYNKILKYVNSSYKEGDYNWGNIIVK